jgi:exopolyphosphatase / guanosine-5'-triphosphate,3'-diphosphate pyrophosphatase
MAEITPRWEWRTFGTSFGGAETALDRLTPSALQESDELYFLPASFTRANVKIRDDLLDIKVLEEVDRSGLERWVPVLKAGFPLDRTDVERACEALGVRAPVPGLHSSTLAELQDTLREQGVRPVAIHKRRVRYSVGGCMAELADVTADGSAVRTIAVESEDPSAVLAAIDSLRLGVYVNTNYTQGLAAMVERRPERFAVIDVGTNSVKFHLAERIDSAWRTVVDRAEVTRLGEGLEQRGSISSEATERTAAAIQDMVEEARRNGALAIAAVGTAGLRMARNGAAVVDTIRRTAGIGVEVISGEEEGRLAYLAVMTGLGLADREVVVFDTGGGSSQFTCGRGAEVDERFSVPVGAVRFTERYGLAGRVDVETLTLALDAISNDLARIDGRSTPDALVAMGGTITNITAVSRRLTTYDPEAVHGTVLDLEEIDRQIELYRTRDTAERRQMVGLQPQRADIILAGALIVRTIMAKLGCDRLTVSDRGLRHGVLVERFGE